MMAKNNENMVVKTAFLNIDTPTLQEGLKSFEGTGVNKIVYAKPPGADPRIASIAYERVMDALKD
jgi:sirohydrochlorin ferrochelatase